MRINQVYNKKVTQLNFDRKKEVNNKQQDKLNDRITISQRSLNLKEIKKQLAGIPEIRQEKVDSLKSRIQSGTYRVSAGAIASKIINNNLE